MRRTILMVFLGVAVALPVVPVLADREPPNFDIRPETTDRSDRARDSRHYRRVNVHGHPYYYRGGRFYRRHNDVFLTVGAPIGARVDRLPAGYVSFSIGPRRYYRLNSTYYLWNNRSRDYVVVERPREVERVKVQPKPEPDVYIQAEADQTTAQLQRDRYECELWSAMDTAYDPARDGKLIREVPYQDNPSRGATMAGTVAGAIAGSVIADSGEGIAVGATLGTILGAAAENSGERKVKEDSRQRAAAMERYTEFKRAFGECMAGRGYAVR